MALRCEAAAYSHIGGRRNNEDNFFMNGVHIQREMLDMGGKCAAEFREGTQIYAVCDGMGGAMFGEEAALLTVETLRNYKALCARPDTSVNIQKLCRQTDREINRLAEAKGKHAGESGTTLAMLILRERCFRTAHLGDSRIYRLRRGVLECLTVDHSQVQMLIDSGEISLEKAWRHPLKNIITRHLGMPEGMTGAKPDIGQRFELELGDKYLICSDGLSDNLRDETISEIMAKNISAAESAEELVRRALSEAAEMGVSSDNVTVVRLNVCELGEKGSVARRLRRLAFSKAVYGVLMVIAAAGIIMTGAEILRYILR